MIMVMVAVMVARIAMVVVSMMMHYDDGGDDDDAGGGCDDGDIDGDGGSDGHVVMIVDDHSSPVMINTPARCSCCFHSLADAGHC